MPLRGSSQLVEVGGAVRLEVSIAGPDSSPSVVLLHGWPVTSLHWRATVPALSETGYRSICAELRGQGGSEGPGTFAKEALARDVTALADTLGLSRFALIGHDWGGTVAYLVAANPGGRVAALVIEEELLPGGDERLPEPGRAHYPTWHAPLHRVPGLAEALVEGRSDVYHRAFLRQSAGPMPLPAEAECEYLTAYRDSPAMLAGFAYYRTSAEDEATIAARSGRPLTLPVLTIGGEYGMGVAVERCLSARAADVRHLQVTGAGHYPAEQRADVVNPALLAFLSEHLR